ncbi:MAG: hypothetical protein H6502_03835 [Candidatus Woesearchaeota archaeon]|nr:MAG: hypothetical protein H6502_03835 [Candidatus Woesearchaeota archaeon]
MLKWMYIQGVHEEKGRISSILSEQLDKRITDFEKWSSINELANLTLSEIQQSFFKEIEDSGNEWVVIARSLGGGVALVSPHESVKRLVLLAPAVQFGEEDKFHENTQLKHLSSFFDNVVTKEFIKKHKKPILIIHDRKDKKIPFVNSQKIANSCSNITLVESEQGHEFTNLEEVSEIIKSWITSL